VTVAGHSRRAVRRSNLPGCAAGTSVYISSPTPVSQADGRGECAHSPRCTRRAGSDAGVRRSGAAAGRLRTSLRSTVQPERESSRRVRGARALSAPPRSCWRTSNGGARPSKKGVEVIAKILSELAPRTRVVPCWQSLTIQNHSFCQPRACARGRTNRPARSAARGASRRDTDGTHSKKSKANAESIIAQYADRRGHYALGIGYYVRKRSAPSRQSRAPGPPTTCQTTVQPNRSRVPKGGWRSRPRVALQPLGCEVRIGAQVRAGGRSCWLICNDRVVAGDLLARLDERRSRQVQRGAGARSEP